MGGTHSVLQVLALKEERTKAWKFSSFSGNQEILSVSGKDSSISPLLTKEGRQQLADAIYHNEYPADRLLFDRESHEWQTHNLWPSLSRSTGAGILKVIARATAEKSMYLFSYGLTL